MIALDTNVILYAEGVDDAEREAAARAIILRASGSAIYVPTQVFAELYRALTLKFKRSRPEALATVQAWQATAQVIGLSTNGFNDALSLSTIHGVQIFDSMILVSAIEADCAILLSEDMQHGFEWRGCTVVNPFVDPLHQALRTLIDAADSY